MKFIIKNGLNAPTTTHLMPFEIGWSRNSKNLYINNNGEITRLTTIATLNGVVTNDPTMYAPTTLPVANRVLKTKSSWANGADPFEYLAIDNSVTVDSSNLITSGGTFNAIKALQTTINNALLLKANDNQVVKTSGNQEIHGTKKFMADITTPYGIDFMGSGSVKRYVEPPDEQGIYVEGKDVVIFRAGGSNKMSISSYGTTFYNTRLSNVKAGTQLQDAVNLAQLNGKANLTGAAFTGRIELNYQGALTYNNVGLEIREREQVLHNQSSEEYAPAIGFHWGNRLGNLILMDSSGILRYGSAGSSQPIVLGNDSRLTNARSASSVSLSSISVDTINGMTHGNAILRQLSGGQVAVGSDARQLRLTGSTSRPYYTTSSPVSTQGVELALLSDIPTAGGEYELTKDKIDTALRAGTSSATLQLGSGATSSGYQSAAIGMNASATGRSSTALGHTAKANADYSTALGQSTQATADYSTALGYNARALGLGSTAIGVGAATGNTDNKMQLGNTSLSSLEARVQLTVTSDIRDKTDIEEVPKALDFIKDLNPITYVSNDRENYISEEQKETDTYKDYLMVEDYDRTSHSQGTKKGKRRRVGLSAQEVREKLIEHYGSDNYANVVNDNFVEFEERELDVPKDLENKLTMSYETMVPFLIKAIQEQQEQIEELKKEINKR